MDDKKVTKGQFVVTVSEGGGDLPDYEMLAAEEPIKVNITDVTEVEGMYEQEDGTKKQQLKFTLKVAEGQPGAGQTYGLWVNAPTSNLISPRSGLFQRVISKVYPDGAPDDLDIADLLGKPLRIELGQPSPSKKDPERNIQRIVVTKSPTKDQKELTEGVTIDAVEAEFKAAMGG